METLKVFGMLFFVGGAYLWASGDDYHKMFDKQVVMRYNCSILNGAWYQDIPSEVIEKCKSGEREIVYVKTYQE